MSRHGIMRFHQLLELETNRTDEVKRLYREKGLKAVMNVEETIDKRRHLRQMHQELKERQIEDALIKAEEERINREKQREQEERISKELARIAHEKQKDEKMRQQVRANSLEIRELESKLLAAYVSKERNAQLAEREAMRRQNALVQAELADSMKREREDAAAELLKQEEKQHQEMTQLKKELDAQVMEKEIKRQEAYEQFLKEKLMVDEIIRKIYEEEQMERQLKLEKIQATKQEIDVFKWEQAKWKRLEQEKIEAENRRIMEYMKQQQDEEESRKTRMKEREEAKQQIRKMLCEKMEKDRKQRDDIETIRQEFYLEEQEEAERKKDIEEMEKRIRQKLMLQQNFQEHKAFKEIQKQRQKQEDQAFRETMMAKFAEDDRIEQMNARKRRMKQLEHRHEVERLIEDKRRQREAEEELEAKARAAEKQEEAVIKRIIEEERLKLLKQHAVKLIGNFPKDFLRKDDLEHFDEDFRKNFETRLADEPLIPD